MKKVLFLLPVFMIYSCTKVKYGTIDTFDIYNMFDIHFYQDFEDNTIGNYLDHEWREDWNNPAWANRDIPQEIMQDHDPENGSKVLRFHFPEGGYGADKSGGQWWTDLGRNFNELYFSYKIKFQPGFQWVMMGKAHGLLGEPVPGPGAKPQYDHGFSARICWHDLPDYRLLSYYYHQNQQGEYGDITGWSTSPDIETGRWYTLTLRVVMNTVNNDVGNNDGIIEGFINGKLVSQIGNVRFRNYEYIGINLLAIATFYGGEGDEWAPQSDEWIETDDFIVFTYKDRVNVPRGNMLSPQGRILILPESY